MIQEDWFPCTHVQVFMSSAWPCLTFKQLSSLRQACQLVLVLKSWLFRRLACSGVLLEQHGWTCDWNILIFPSADLCPTFFCVQDSKENTIQHIMSSLYMLGSLLHPDKFCHLVKYASSVSRNWYVRKELDYIQKWCWWDIKIYFFMRI